MIEEKDAAARRETLSNLLILLAREDLPTRPFGLVTRRKHGARRARDGNRARPTRSLSASARVRLAKQTKSLLRTAVETNPPLGRACLFGRQLPLRERLARRGDHALSARRSRSSPTTSWPEQPGIGAGRPARRLAEGLKTIDRAIAKFGADATLLDTKGQILVFWDVLRKDSACS